MIWRVELARLVRERLAVAVLVVAILACALAFVSGRSVLNTQIDGRAALASDQAAERKGFIEQLASAKGTSVPTLPNGARFQAVAPLPVLVDFSIGRAAFENYSTGISLRVRQDGLFKRTQFDNPEMLARGRIDLGTVAVVIAPLLLIGLGFGLFSADRDSGAARLILAQSGSPLKLLLIRGLLRIGLVALPIFVTAALLIIVGPLLVGRMPAAGAWLVLACLGLLMWSALILWVNSFNITAETSALLLVGLWTLFVFAIPTSLATAAGLAYPPPSRLELIATARAAEVGASTEYENDHPTMTGENVAAVQASIQKSASIAKTVEASVVPLLDRFEERQRQQSEFVALLQYASPSLVLGNALEQVSQTDASRFLRFRQATRDYLSQIKGTLGPLVQDGRAMSRSDYDRVPIFAWRPVQRFTAAEAAYIAAIMAVLALVAFARLRRAKLD